MGYDSFRTEYDTVMSAATNARLSPDELAQAHAHLSSLRDTLAGPDQERATADLAELQGILALVRQTSYVTSPAFDEAQRVLNEAMAEGGTDKDRIKRARKGLKQIEKLARRAADQHEEFSILRLAEPLAMLIDSLQTQPGGRR